MRNGFGLPHVLAIFAAIAGLAAFASDENVRRERVASAPIGLGIASAGCAIAAAMAYGKRSRD